MRRIAIQEFLLESRNALVLDVRSPAEYKHAHLPGAVSLPLFSDEERAVVGTAYKQASRETAIKIGLDFFGPKMRLMVEEVEKLIEQRSRRTGEQTNKEQMNEEGNEEMATQPHTSVLEFVTNNPKLQTPYPKLFLYCWRGGMRSGAVAWLLNLYGFNVTVLAGGYKSFRNWSIRAIAYPYRLKLIGGFTGSGKTTLLQALQAKGEPAIDLEKIAVHKGSAFGNIGLPPQPSQEMFENMLALELLSACGWQMPGDNNNETSIWVEDESQRIGHINIPGSLWTNMRRSPVYFLDIPFDERLQNLVEEYGNLDKERMIAAIQRISKRLGPLETRNAIRFLEEGQTEESFRILLHYYDKQYIKGLHNRSGLETVLTKIPCEKVTVENAALVSQAQVVL